jgi:hypothetical protein
MIAMKEAAGVCRLAFLAAALAMLLAACSTGPGSFASHGEDYIPAFDTPYSGGARG